MKGKIKKKTKKGTQLVAKKFYPSKGNSYYNNGRSRWRTRCFKCSVRGHKSDECPFLMKNI